MEQAKDNQAGSYHHKHNLKSYISLLIIIAAFAGITSLLNLKGYSQDFRSRADQAADDANCPQNPDCCVRMASSHDPFECEWPIRGYCTLDICNGIDGKKQRCGWYWIWHNQDDTPGIGTNTPNGYGCMIGDSEATMRPRYTPSGATITPRPLYSPTPLPTSIPPTSILPTMTPVIIQPTISPLPTRPFIPASSPTAIIPPSTYYPSPTLPYTGGGGGTPTPTFSTQPSIINNQPTSTKLQPTSYNQHPSVIPKPTKEPVLPKIGKEVGNLWREFKKKLFDFFTQVIP